MAGINAGPFGSPSAAWRTRWSQLHIELSLSKNRFSIEYVQPDEEVLLPLLRELFKKHWREIVFGVFLQGAVYEIRLASAAKLSILDGYLTIDTGTWHCHLCIGAHKGNKANPVPKALAQRRRIAKAAFLHQFGGGHYPRELGVPDVEWQRGADVDRRCDRTRMDYRVDTRP